MPLRSSRQIGHVLKQGTRTAGRYLSAHALSSDEQGTRVAVVAGRRAGGAVSRNRAKRRLRAAIQACQLPDSMDLVLIAKSDLKAATFQDLQDELVRVVPKVSPGHV